MSEDNPYPAPIPSTPVKEREGGHDDHQGGIADAHAPPSAYTPPVATRGDPSEHVGTGVATPVSPLGSGDPSTPAAALQTRAHDPSTPGGAREGKLYDSDDEHDELVARLSRASMDISKLPVFDAQKTSSPVVATASHETTRVPAATPTPSTPASAGAAQRAQRTPPAPYMLHVFLNAFVISPNARYTDSVGAPDAHGNPLRTQKLLTIDRETQQVTTVSLAEHGSIPSGAVTIPIWGIMGTFDFLAGPYLVVVTHTNAIKGVPCVDGESRTVHQVRHTAAFPYATKSTLSHAKRTYEQAHLNSLRSLLDDRGFLFALNPHACDLTRSLQHQVEPPACDDAGGPAAQTSSPRAPAGDSRAQAGNAADATAADGPTPASYYTLMNKDYWWNSGVLEPFLTSPEIAHWALPVIRGFVAVRPCQLDGESFTLALIARRSVHRPGLRYKCRGINMGGHCANAVESEQVVLYQGRVASFLEIRASVPLFWRQDGKGFKPKITFSESAEVSQSAMAKHFETVHATYGDCTILTLLRTEGAEGELQNKYQSLLTAVKDSATCSRDLNYIQFDFHRYCKSGAPAELWNQNLRVPMHDTASDAQRHAFFFYDPHREPETDAARPRHTTGASVTGGAVLLRQTGVIRTNCLDCLDRTNLLQAQIARRCLWSQLQVMKVTSSELSLAALDDTFNNLWADHGNAISQQYAGSDAMKGDFTRTGKRHLGGILRDGVSSLKRYYNNNFGDHMKMQSIGLMRKRFHLDLSARPDITAAAVAECRRKVEQGELESGEFIIDAWPLTAVSKLDLEKECVLVLTDRAYYRCQCSFAECEVMAIARVGLESIKTVQTGIFHYSKFAAQGRHNRDKETDGQYYGLRITDHKSKDKGESTGPLSQIKAALASAMSSPRVRTFKPVGQFEVGDKQPKVIIETISQVLGSAMSTNPLVQAQLANGSRGTAGKKGGFWNKLLHK